MILRRPATNNTDLVYGVSINYVVVNGQITVEENKDILALMAQGWQPVVGVDKGGVLVYSITGITPDATAGTYGTAKDILPEAGFSSFVPLSFDLVFGGTFGTETVTAQLVITYTDGSTQTITSYTATAVGTTSLTIDQLRGLFATGKFVGIASIAVATSSTLASSATTLAINSHATQF